MDELEISGKRYISSKQAAKENRYHVDYIGQLIRAGKIVGTKVGRTWYVETNSLATYLDKEVPQTSLRLNVAPTGSKLQPLLPEEKEVSWAYKAAPTQRTQVFPARVPTSGLTYISEDEPLLRALNQNTAQLRVKRESRPILETRVAQNTPVIVNLRGRGRKSLVFMVILGLIVFATTLVLSYYLQSWVIVSSTESFNSLHF